MCHTDGASEKGPPEESAAEAPPSGAAPSKGGACLGTQGAAAPGSGLSWHTGGAWESFMTEDTWRGQERHTGQRNRRHFDQIGFYTRGPGEVVHVIEIHWRVATRNMEYVDL